MSIKLCHFFIPVQSKYHNKYIITGRIRINECERKIIFPEGKNETSSGKKEERRINHAFNINLIAILRK